MSTVPAKSILKASSAADHSANEPLIQRVMNIGPSANQAKAGKVGRTVTVPEPARSYLQDTCQFQEPAIDRLIAKLRSTSGRWVECDGMILFREGAGSLGRCIYSVKRDLPKEIVNILRSLRCSEAMPNAAARSLQTKEQIAHGHQLIIWANYSIYRFRGTGPETTCELLAWFPPMLDNRKPSLEMVLEKLELWKPGTHGWFSWSHTKLPTACFIRGENDLSFTPTVAFDWPKPDSPNKPLISRHVVEALLADCCERVRQGILSKNTWTYTFKSSGFVLEVKKTQEKLGLAVVAAIVIVEIPKVQKPTNSAVTSAAVPSLTPGSLRRP